MINLTHLRAEPELYQVAWKDRGEDVDVSALLALDAQVRELKTSAEAKKAEANAASKAIGAAAKAGEDVAAAKEHARTLGDEVKRMNEERAEKEAELTAQLEILPNICLPAVPKGLSEDENVEREIIGERREFDFKAKPHWELAEKLGIIDFQRGTNLSGSGFVTYNGKGAKLQRALIHYFLSFLEDHDYQELSVPYLVLPEVMRGTGQLPKFADQLYRCADDDLYLIPTAEVPVTNLYRNEILDGADLPLQFCAHTPCFRREAGAAGIGTRGITRMHQFDKVEMVWLTTPERSNEDLLILRSHAEKMLQGLGLQYRILELCTGDTGFSSAHTYDLEVWSPGTESWLEVSSCSSFTDFQARRANLRYRSAAGEKPTFLHTLNGSGLALPRCLIAVLETYQQADGSVTVPDVLRPYMGVDSIS